MFTENKYSRWYFKIVDAARLSPRKGYVEEHHVIPTSMGGPDTPENKVRLSAREHFIVHLLLTKMVTEKKALMQMRKAVRFMMCIPKKMQGLRWMLNGRTFEIAKKEAALANKGNKEIAAKISASHLGKKLSTEHKAKIGQGLKGTIKSPEAAKAASEKQKGKPKSEASREKMRLAWIKRRLNKAAGLEARAPYSEQALSNLKAAAIKRGERQRATRGQQCA